MKKDIFKSKEKTQSVNTKNRAGYTNINNKKKKEDKDKIQIKKKVKYQSYIDNRISLNYLKGTI